MVLDLFFGKGESVIVTIIDYCPVCRNDSGCHFCAFFLAFPTFVRMPLINELSIVGLDFIHSCPFRQLQELPCPSDFVVLVHF